MAVILERWKAEILACTDENEARRASRTLSKFINEYREKLAPVVPSLQGTRGLHEGSQTVVLWRNREVAKLRQSCRQDIFELSDNKSDNQESVSLESDQSKSEKNRRGRNRAGKDNRILLIRRCFWNGIVLIWPIIWTKSNHHMKNFANYSQMRS